MSSEQSKSKSFLRALIGTCSALLLSAALFPAQAEESLKEDAKQAGRAVGSTARDIGQGAKKVGKDVGKGAKQVGKAVGDTAKEGVDAAKAGGRELKRAITGN